MKKRITQDQFNSKGRALPDLSAVAIQIPVVVNGNHFIDLEILLQCSII